MPKLSKDDRQYHIALVAELERANAVWDHWRSYITAKYELQPGDSIDTEGKIMKGEIQHTTARDEVLKMLED